MTEIKIPASIDEVDADWLGAATGWDVQSATSEQIGVGIGVSSALYRVALEGSCPESVIVKLPALDEAAVFTSTILRMYHREVGFFAEIAAECPVRVPASYYGAVADDSGSFVVVMEDLCGLRVVDQVAGMELSDAELSVDALAAWHATWWGKADHYVDSGLTLALSDPIYPAVLPMVFDEGWAKVTEHMELPASIMAVGEHYTSAIEHLLKDLSQGPNTLAHGDYRCDNLLFDADGSVVVLDFQLIGTGSAAYDLAYFVTQSLDADLASTHERSLFDRWIEGLRAGGVGDDQLPRMWEDYRKAALFCLSYPIVASRGMDLSDPRQHDLLACMNTRYARAVEELDLAELL